MRKFDGWEIYTKEPESFTVGELNELVKILREKLREEEIETQKAKDDASRLRFPDTTGQ